MTDQWEVKVIQAIGDHEDHDNEFEEGTSKIFEQADYAHASFGQYTAKELVEHFRLHQTFTDHLEAPGGWVIIKDLTTGKTVYDDFFEVY